MRQILFSGNHKKTAGLGIALFFCISGLLAQVHIEPANPQICPGESVLLQVVADDPDNVPTFFMWGPAEGLSNTDQQSTFASPTTTTVYFVETNAGGASVTVEVLPAPTVSFSGLPFFDLCSNVEPITLVGSPAGGTFSTTAPSGLSGNILNPALVPTTTPYTLTYSYTAPNGCSNTDEQALFVYFGPTASFSGLDPAYCVNDGDVTLIGSPPGGTFTTDVPFLTLDGDVANFNLFSVPTGTTYNITYTIGAGDPNCPSSSTQSFIVNDVPFVSISGLPDGQLCSDIPPTTLIGSPAGGTFSTDAPSGLSGNVLSPALIPPNIPYTLTYTYTAPNGCSNTAERNIITFTAPTVTFSGLNPDYCVGDGPVTLTGSPLGGFFFSDVPGLVLDGDVVELDLSLVPTGTTFTISYYYSAGGDPPCAATAAKNFIVNPIPAVSFSGLPFSDLCSNVAPITLVGSPAGGTFSTTAPSGLSGNILNPALVPTTTPYTLTYSYSAPNGCSNTDEQSLFVYFGPTASFSGLDPAYCVNDGDVTLIGSPPGGTFSTDVPFLTLDGDVANFNLFSVPTGTTYNITYTIGAGDPNCPSSSTQSFIVNDVPFVSISGLPDGQLCSDIPPTTLIGSPAGGTFSTDAPSGLSGNVLSPALIPPNIPYTLTYTYTAPNGCSNIAERNIITFTAPTVTFSGLNSNYCVGDGPVTLTGSPLGGFFFSDVPGLVLDGDVVDLDLSLVPTGTTFTISYYYSAGGDPPCAATAAKSFIVNPIPAVSFSGLPFSDLCSNVAPITLVGSPAGGTFSTTAPSGLSGNILNPALVPTTTPYTLTYSYTAPNGCSNTDEQSLFVYFGPTASFSGLDPAYCVNDGDVTLIGSPPGGTFSTDVPFLTLDGDVANFNLFSVPTGTTYNITYTIGAGDPNCPSSSTQSFIVNDVPFVSISGLPDGQLCSDIPPTTLIGSPAGGTFSTDAPSGLSGNVLSPALIPPNIPYTLTYTYTAPNGCSNTAERNIITFTAPTVTFSGLNPDYCVGDGPVTLTGSPLGGFFFSDVPGLVLDGDVVELDLSLVPTGTTFTISYYYSAGGDPPCAATAAKSFIVNPIPAVSFSGLPFSDLCSNVAPITLVGSPAGGTFSTTAPSGLSGNILNPALVPTTTPYTLTYSYTAPNGCSNTDEQSLFVYFGPTASFSGLDPAYCVNDGDVTLIGSPPGGTFTTDVPFLTLDGDVANFNLFSVPTGTTYNITYTIGAGDPNCPSSSTQSFIVNDVPFVSISGLPDGQLCSDIPPTTLIGSPAGGTFSTDAPSGLSGNVLSPALIPPNIPYTLTYTYTAPNGCSNTAERNIITFTAPTVTFSGLNPDYCVGDGPVTLTGSPLGGFFFSDVPGLVLDGDVVDLDLSLVPTGTTFTISYYYSAGGDPPCAATAAKSFMVNPIPAVSFSGLPATICANTAPIVLTGNPAGGTFSTNAPTGLSGNILTPALIPPGNEYSLTYTYTDGNGCTNSTNQSFMVNSLPVVGAGSYPAVCVDAPNLNLIGTPAGGTFSGAGVSGNTFDPSVGTQTITYSFTNANGCTNSAQTTITVNPLPVVSAGSYPTVCIDAANVILIGTPAGGTFSGTGVSGNTFDPSVGTQIITYSFTNANGCTNTAQTTINVVPLPNVDAGTYAAICVNAPNVNLVGTPAGGFFEGVGVSGNTFDPSVGTQTITYTFSNANGCVNSDQTTITVNPLPVVGAGSYPAVCVDAPNLNLIGTPAGGIFSGTGVSGNTFDPSVGTQTITYSFTNSNGCTNTAQTTITVNPLPLVSAGSYPVVCFDAANVILTGTPAGGTFSGTGVSGNTFDPSVGTQIITYSFTNANGCTNTAQTTINVVPLPIVDAGTYAAICVNAPNVNLVGTPAGGFFEGVGVSGNTFDPSVGTQTITYTFSNANGCVNSDQTTITVNPLPVVGAGSYPAVCVDAPNLNLIGTPAGGTFSGAGVSGNTFDPSVGTQTITYSFTNANGCTNSAQTTITVNPLPVVSAGSYPTVCIDAANVILTGTPAGGTFSGTGVSSNTFDPSVGTQIITYSFTNANGCTNTAQTTINVVPLPIVDAGTYAAVCVNAPNVNLVGTPAGGFFEGVGVSSNTFDPSVGTQTITYTFSNANGCVNSDQTTITVNPLPVVGAGSYPAVCVDAPNLILIGTPTGGTFSGTGVSGNTFDPSVGTQIITYAFTNANGCTNTAQTTITVNPLPLVSAGSYPVVCFDAANVILTGTPAGGTFNGTGVSGNTFDPSVGTQIITYSFTNANGCTNTAQTTINVVPLPIVDAGTYAAVCVNAPNVNLVGTPAGGFFEGVGVSGNTFDPSVGTQTITYTFSNANGCVNSDQTTITVNPLPVVGAGSYPAVCVDAPNLNLIGTPAGGTFSGTGVSGNTFDPSVGTQTITYSFTNANGCTNTAQTTITVNPLPLVSAGSYPAVCVNAVNVNLIGTPAGGTFSGTGVSGNTFNPAFGTQTITYIFTNANGCTNSDQTTITVNPLPIVDAGTYPAACINAPNVPLIGAPAGGFFEGIGINGNTFDPSVGTQTVTYIYTNANGCTNNDQTTINVNPLPIVNAGTYPSVCLNSSPFILAGLPVGGIFSGTGVIGNTFNPAVGTQTINYTYTDSNGCTNSDQSVITVNNLPVVSAGSYSVFCFDSEDVTLTGNPAGGIFSGTGVNGNLFDPSVGSQIITYTYTDANGCTNSSQSSIVVQALPVVDAGTYASVCIDAADITLTGTPAGGVFSGIGVSGNTFDPSFGTQSVTYFYTAGNGCSNAEEVLITVNNLPGVEAGAYEALCVDANDLALNGTPQGGTFTGIGVTNNTFDPSQGTQTLTYHYTDSNGCTNSGQTTIVVNPLPEVNAGAYAATCLDGFDVVLAGTPEGGIFTGTGVTGNSFDPSAGSQTLEYQYTDGNGCSNSDQATIEVTATLAVSFSGLLATYCANDEQVVLSGNPEGGVFSTNAPSGLDGSVLSPTFTPTGTLFSMTYTYNDDQGCSGADIQNYLIHALPVVEIAGLTGAYCIDAAPQILSASPAGGVLSTDAPSGLQGTTLSPALVPPGTSFTISYAYTDGNGCTNEANEVFIVNNLPIVDAGDYPAPCANENPIDLGGNPKGGDFSGIGVNNNAFDPTAGTQTITYTYTDANGCVNSDQIMIVVNALPEVSLNGLDPEYCSNDTPVMLNGSPAGGAFGTDTEGALIEPGGMPTFRPGALPDGGTVIMIYSFVTPEGCEAVAEQEVSILASPFSSISDTLVMCGGSGSLSAQPQADGQSYVWSTGQTTPEITVTLDGAYAVTITGANGCVTQDSSRVIVQDGQQFISNLLVSATACAEDTVHFFDISDVLTGVDSYFWTFGDGATSTQRDPVHVYSAPGIYEVALTATSIECENVSVAKQIQIQSCRTDGSGDVFDVVKAYPNPAEQQFNLDIALNEVQDLLVTLYDINGRIVESRHLSEQSLYQLKFSDLRAGVYLVEVQSIRKAVVLRVVVM